MTDLRIDIPNIDGVIAALQAIPQAAEEAQRFVLQPLGDAYLAALLAETPRGQGENRGQRLAESYEVDQSYSPTSSQYRIRNQAPQLQYVIKGRGPIVARGRALRFTIGGRVFFRKRVGPVEPNNFPIRVQRVMQPQVDGAAQQIATYIVRRFRG